MRDRRRISWRSSAETAVFNPPAKSFRIRPQEERMRLVSRPRVAVCLFVAGLGAGCASAPQKPPQPAQPTTTPTSTPSKESELHTPPPTLGSVPYSDGDVDFMSGMIPHHAQAVIMAGWAPTHGARHDVAVLCERILVGQADAIRSMQ